MRLLLGTLQEYQLNYYLDMELNVPILFKNTFFTQMCKCEVGMT